MKVKSLVNKALSIAFAMVLILVVVPSGMASADLQPNLVKSEFNQEPTEIVSNSSDRLEETAVLDETLTNGNESTGCLTLAEGQNINLTELKEVNLPCIFKSDCTQCDRTNAPQLCTHYKIRGRCKEC